ncbi:Nonribosomal peptide synthetase gloA [Paramyrothecium foliicola]|nr:Nonribosomal peptide synthetase gloA [Paramyrothecium foliicola]
MGSVDHSLRIRLGDFNSKAAPDVAISDFVETVWAVTCSVYRGDEEVSFLSTHKGGYYKDSKDASEIGTTRIRSYTIREETTPAQIAATGRSVDAGESNTGLFGNDPGASALSQITRKTLIWISRDGDETGAEHRYENDEYSMIFAFSIQHGILVGNLWRTTEKHIENFINIADTAEQIGQWLFHHWTSPLTQLDFLGPSNWLHIARAAPPARQIGGSILCDILKEQKQVRPNDISINAWDGSLTYAELHDLSLRMAASLIAKRIIAESRIGFCMRKSKWAFVALWGVLMAGCTVVPLDIRNPSKRMQELLRRTGAEFVVADEWTAESFKGLDVDVLSCHSNSLSNTNSFDPGVLWPHVSPKTVAFILFTSGSTGIPKGVVIEHGPVYATAAEFAAEYDINHTSRIFQFSPFVFDASIGDIFMTSLKGGCLCVPSEDERMDNVADAIGRSRATHTSLPNSVVSMIQPHDAPNLQCMISAGEALSFDNFSRWHTKVNLVSGYGLTESIIYDSVARPKHLSADYRNIGSSRGRIWITSPKDPEKLMPIGALGEIIVEGPILARGYLDDPKRTAERFIKAPSWLQKLHGQIEDHRCYRTGDYGILNIDGTILYMGRMDFQVKIRGQRVELGEIESGLSTAEPTFEQVAVEAIQLRHRGNTQMLVAFISLPFPASDGSLRLLPLDRNLRNLLHTAHLKFSQAFPPHMVPSLLLPVSQLPKSAVGKRDRNVLRQWGASLTEAQMAEYQIRTSSSRAPETPGERLLQGLWAEVLGAPAAYFGADDNFFHAGGDSVKAIELVAELRRQGRVLTVREIFQNPQMSDMAKLIVIDEIIDEPPKPFELIPTTLSEDHARREAARVCGVNPSLIEDIYPTTPMQEALMAITVQRESHIYTHRIIFSIPEDVDLERFKRSWEILVLEQPILRTRVITLPGAGTLQVVLASNINWHSHANLQDFVDWDDKTPFKAGMELSRFAIIESEGSVPLFAWSGHHAINDGWSRPAMFDEFRHIYLHGAARKQPPYTSFIKYINQLNLEMSDDFWMEQFPDQPETFPQLPSPNYSPEALQSNALGIKLERSKTSNITVATLIQAAWGITMSSYTNTDEVIFGLTLSGRDVPVQGITKMMGITITTVPVRIVLDNTSTISQYLEEVQQYISQVKEHQHVGLQRISQLSPETRSAANFQNLLVIQPSDEDDDHLALSKMGLTLIQREERDTQDLGLTVQCAIRPGSDALQVVAHFDNKVIISEQVQCILHLFEHIIHQLCTESDEVSLHDMSRLSPHDLNVLSSVNAKIPATVEETLHGLFEEQARQTPSAIALDGFDGQLTYGELDSLSNILAGYLQERGVTNESRVVLSFSKSKLPIIAILATLKSGGVCVSINPEHPTQRLVDLCKEVDASLIICDADGAKNFENQGLPVIGIKEAELEDLRPTYKDHSSPLVASSNASFVVFTSGSTGKPKGSVLEHRSLATHLKSLGQTTGLSPDTRTLQFSAYTFDVHILEIVGTLIHGGCVCVISDHERMNRLGEVMNKRRVNFASLTKTVSRLLEPEEVPTLKTLILTGEANARQDYKRWASHVRLFNGLGPSECTPLVCLTRTPVGLNDDPSNIGHSMGCHLWVTDHRRPDRLVPVGCVGELLVEGPIVGRGYINRPKETKHAFITDPKWARQGQTPTRRFYRSGDLARMNTDGSITFVGRMDNQVKIHGQRVELGEIEDHLRRCNPMFAASAVEALKISSRGGSAALAVFCRSPENDKTYSHGAAGDAILPMSEANRDAFLHAQSELANTLPGYMVPSIFLPVRNLPLNASGKLERKKLQDWVSQLSSDDMGQYFLTIQSIARAPETAMEKRLHALWVKVLGVPANTIHAEDHFFRLGGDSVLSMKLIAAARAESISMIVADVFKTPVLKDMALTMVDLGASEDESSVSPQLVEPMSLIKNKTDVAACVQAAAQECCVPTELVEDIYPCTPTQEALMAVSSHRSKAYTYQIVLKIPPSMDLNYFKETWEKLVAAQPIYRTRIVYQRGLGSLQVVLDAKIDWTITERSLEQYVHEDGHLLVEYGSELCRFAILQNNGENIFVGTLHHALYDGWSLMRTYDEFSRIYKAGEVNKSVVPFNKFFHQLLSSDEKEIDQFWTSQYPNIVESYPRLPSARYTPRPQRSQASTIPLKRKSGSVVTLATVVQVAWAVLLSKYSDSKEVVFGLTLSGRDAPVSGIEDIIAPTIATIPLHAYIDDEMTIADILGEMQMKTAAICRYQHAGLQRIRKLSPEASAATDFRSILVVNTMGDAEINTPLEDLGLETVRSGLDEFLDLALSVECTIRPESLQIHINYDNQVVEDGQVKWMIAQLQHLVSILVEEQGTRRLRDVTLASPEELNYLGKHQGNVPESLHSQLCKASLSPNEPYRIWITERNNIDHLIPMGCVGEIVIEYYERLHDSSNTADIEHPLSSKVPTWMQLLGQRTSNGSFQQTGQLGRYIHDGTLEVLGSMQLEVKCRTQHVDTNEVILRMQEKLPGNSEVVVDMINSENATTLAAFVKFHSITDDRKSDLLVQDESTLYEFQKIVEELQESLPDCLPQFMIPSAFIPVCAIPMSTTTQVDRLRLQDVFQNLPKDFMSDSERKQVPDQPINNIEESLQAIWSQILNHKPAKIGRSSTFISLGGDSITAMQVVSECRKAGIKVKVSTILQKKTIMAIAPYCTMESAQPRQSTSIEVVENHLPFNLSPIQSLYFEQETQGPTRYNQSFFCRIKKRVTTSEVQRAMDTIVKRHGMLRARFQRNKDDGSWKQYTTPAEGNYYRFKAHTICSINDDVKNSATAGIVAHIEESLSAIDITSGPVFSVDYFNVEGEEPMVYFLAHHLVIDLVSWRIIWRDLEDILQRGGLSPGHSPQITFQNWVTLQEQITNAATTNSTSVYPHAIPVSNFEFWGVPPEQNVTGNAHLGYSFSLPTETTKLILGQANEAMRTTPLDIMVGLLSNTFWQVFKDREVPSIFIEHHGREPGDDGAEEVDLSQTVGWFTTVYPVHVPKAEVTTPSEAIRCVKDSRHEIPGNGQPYFAYRQISKERSQFSHHSPTEILVNYSGIFQQLESDDGLLQLETRVDPQFDESGPDTHRSAMINLEVEVSNGSMQFAFYVHKDIAHQHRLSQWVDLFQTRLSQILPQLAQQKRTYTLSDFPRLKLTYDDLIELVSNKFPSGSEDIQIIDLYPCTAMQEGILLSQQLDSQVYKFEHIWEFTDNALLPSNLTARLAEVWRSIVQRHSTFRTAIIEHASEHGHFIQAVLEDLPSTRYLESDRIIDHISDISQIIDPDEEGFWQHLPQLTVYHMKDGKIACRLRMSHALMDGMSRELFMSEILGLLTGRSMPQSATEAGRYVEYERSGKSNDSLSYWTEYLKHISPCHIPIAKKQKEVSGTYEYIRLPDNTTKGLAEFCHRLEITPATFIQAAWAVVLGVFTGQEDVCFGYLADGRDAPLDGIQQSIGLFISMQVCRVALAGKAQVMLQGLHDNVIAGLEHRNCSLALIHSMLGMKTPLFNTCLTIQRALEGKAKNDLDSLVNTAEGAERTEFAIALGAAVGANITEIGMSYQTTKIPPAYARSIAGSLEAVIRSLLASEEPSLVKDLNLIGTHDRQLVEQWNTPRQEKVYATIHGLFEEQVRANPSAIATTGFDTEYTYAELNDKAEQIAGLLHARGVTLEVKVVLCFAKSTWPIVAMLGILKAGGVCVSTNPEHPTGRLLDICNELDATVVLCDEPYAAQFREHVPHVLAVNDTLFSDSNSPSDWLRPNIRPENAAFVVYTSGSTGKPKGCVLEHHSVSKSQLVNAKAMRILPTSRAIQFSTYTFDASICEIFAPLVTGACVCVISDEERMDDLAMAINARKADWIMLTPTVAQLFTPASVPTLKTLVFGGEPLGRKPLEIWSGHVHLVNYWGPSECSNSGCINTDVTMSSDPMNIGRASGHSLWITDPGNPHRLAPVGCVGEMVTEGPLVGRGYIHRPDATAASFVTDLAWSRDGSGMTRRFYRTGDLGRFNADGSVTIAGRADSQVKINGQRVELGEIKHQITANLPSGSEVIVDLFAINAQSSAPRLVAFVKLEFLLPTADRPLELEIAGDQLEKFHRVINKLEEALSNTLPHHMIPHIYIPIPRVPLTPSAKTDRKMLRDFAQSFSSNSLFKEETSSEAQKMQPVNDLERDLQKIWSKTLNHPLSKLGINDTFMALGGDSITAMQVVAHCRKAGIRVPIAVILQQKTIAAIAPHCERVTSKSAQLKVPNVADGTPFNLSPIQRRYFDQEPFGGQYNQSMLLRVRQDISTSRLQDAFDAVVARHGMLRARFVKSEIGVWQQRVMPPGKSQYRFSVHACDDVTDNIIEVAEASGRALNVVDGPVFSVDRFEFPDQDGMVFVAAHHLVVDIVSWQTILRELEEFVQSGQLTSATPDITFQQWCDAQERVSITKSEANEVLPLLIPASNFDFWQIPQEENLFKYRILESFEVPEATTQLILDGSNRSFGTTPLEILLGPLLSSFKSVFTERDIPSVFVEHHGRESFDPEIEPSQIVGWFTAMYPLHIPINKQSSATEAVRLVKDFRRLVPQNGRPYFAHRHLTEDGASRFSAHDPVELVVNFAGAFQQLEASDNLIRMEDRIDSKAITDASPEARRWAMIDVDIGVVHGVMTVDFRINKKMAHYERVRQWIGEYQSVLIHTAQELAQQAPQHTLVDFPLLDLNYSELISLLNDTLPQVGIDVIENVLDILPLSAFQKYVIEAHLDTPARQWTYFYFHLPQDTDFSQLQKTCAAMVSHYSILRTLFIKHNDRFLQVVLKSLQPQLDVREAGGSVDDLMREVFHEDLNNLPTLGQSFLRFVVVRTPQSSRLLMRLSHAQFDAMSRIPFVEALAAIYQGQTPTPDISFSQLVHETHQSHKEDVEYWRTVLHGAEPTSVVNVTSQPRFQDTGVIRVEKTMPTIRALQGVTAATLFNAACALLLRSRSASSDITFGRITSGRAALDSKFQNFVGPCVNIVPVRVQFTNDDSAINASSVLQQIHKQHAESIQHETLGLDDIVRDCTEWQTNLDSFPVITQFVNLEEGSKASAEDGSALFDVKVWDPETVNPFPRSLGLGAFPSRDGVKISVAASSKYITFDQVQSITEELCANIAQLSEAPVV